MKILLIDNYDSFTYNLFQYVAEMPPVDPVVVRNDELDWNLVDYKKYDGIIVSPGPGRPEIEADFGISRQAILQSEVPVLGVCLGHQGIGHLFGARVVHAPTPVHGRQSTIHHNSRGIFGGIPSPIKVARYHSLVVDRSTLPDELVPEAETDEGILMALQHRTRPIWGIQFHPESIATEFGKRMIGNFLTLTKEWGLVDYAAKSLSEQTREPV